MASQHFYQQISLVISSYLKTLVKKNPIDVAYNIVKSDSHNEPSFRISFHDQTNANVFAEHLRNDLGITKCPHNEDSHLQHSIDLSQADLELFSTHHKIKLPQNFQLQMSDTPDALTRAEQEVLQIIKNHNALVKVIGAESGKFDFITNQIVDPTTNRPSRTAYYYAHEAPDPTLTPEEVMKTNLLTKKTHMHKPGKCRFTKHKDVVFEHTLKTSATLIPPEPQYMQVISDFIGFLWDIDACKIKPKYIFESNADTFSMFWYDVPDSKPGYADELKKLLCSLESIRRNNNEAVTNKEIIYWNEILAGLPKGRVDAVFSSSDTLEMRLAAWEIMLYTKNKLSLANNIPVLVMQTSNPHRIYTTAEHEKDLQIAAVHTPNKTAAGITNKRADERKFPRNTESKKSGFLQNHPRVKKVLTGIATGLGVLAIAAVSVAAILTFGIIGIAIAMAAVAVGVGIALTIDALKTENKKPAVSNTSQNQNAVEMTSFTRSSTACIHDMGVKINSPAPAANQETFDSTAIAIDMPTITNTNCPLSANVTQACEGMRYKP